MFIKRLQKISLLKNASIYTGANILSALVPFFCMPVLTRYLEPADYGIVAIMGSIISFVTPFVGVNIHGAIAAMYYHDDIYFNDFVKSCMSILVTSSVLVSLILVIFSSYIEKYTLFPGDWLWSIIVICIGQFIFTVQLTILQIKQQAKHYGALQLLNVVLNTGLSVFLVVVFSMNWQGRVIAQVLTVCLLLIINIVFLHKNNLLGLSRNKQYIRRALAFGIPLIPHAISGCLLTMVDRFYVASFIDIDTAGLFVLGAQIGSGMDFLTSSFNKAYVPWLYGKLKDITFETKQRIVRYTYIYFVVILVIAGLYSLIMPNLLGVFVGEKFYTAGNYVWAFAFAGALNGMYYMVGNYIFFTGDTKLLFYRTFYVSIVHVIMSYFFIMYYGAMGACYCVIISYLLLFMAVWHLSASVYAMPWKWDCR